MTKVNMIQMVALKQAREKARIRDITVNGDKATAVFSEYTAPENLIEEYRQYDGSDGHYYFITFYIWHKQVKSYYTGKNISIDYNFSTTKEEGNALFTEIKQSKSININLND